MPKRKICVVTGSRAEFGLLSGLMSLIKQDPDLELQIIATGMHLSPEFGLTYKEIERDFVIDRKIEILLSSDTSVGVSKSMGLAQISFSDAYNELRPDVVVVLGDRFEIFSAVASAMIMNIPVAHIHGGETTAGAVDEAIRHSITKMSLLHFTATNEYKSRVVQLGECPERVFVVGGMGIDRIKNLTLLSREDFQNAIQFKLNLRNLIITYHPVTLTPGQAAVEFEALLKAVDELGNTNLIFTKSNADAEGRVINDMIDTFVAAHSNKSCSFQSLGELRYLSSLQYVDAVVGNSSSGLVEAPSFNIGTINIGNRQLGRTKAMSVIDCEPSYEAIKEALVSSYSDAFKKKLLRVVNPYDSGNGSDDIVVVLKAFNFDEAKLKTFFDISEDCTTGIFVD